MSDDQDRPAQDPRAQDDPDRQGELLACGRPVGDIVDQLDAGRRAPDDSHQASCPHCAAALADAGDGRRALDLVRAAAMRPAAARVPGGLVERVMHGVRDSAAAPPPLLLRPSGGGVPGSIRVRPHVLADIARAAARAHPGVTVARCAAHSREGPAGPGVAVVLGLLVDGSTPLPLLAVAVRRAVRSALRRATGLAEVTVSLAALDLVRPDDQTSVGRAQLLAADGVQPDDLPLPGDDAFERILP